jgi:hypothetical protein
MLAVGCATLFYDGAVAAIVFGIEFAHYSKSAGAISETARIVVVTGLVAGVVGAGSLLLRKKHHRALALLVGLLPLALFAQLVQAFATPLVAACTTSGWYGADRAAEK